MFIEYQKILFSWWPYDKLTFPLFLALVRRIHCSYVDSAHRRPMMLMGDVSLNNLLKQLQLSVLWDAMITMWFGCNDDDDNNNNHNNDYDNTNDNNDDNDNINNGNDNDNDTDNDNDINNNNKNIVMCHPNNILSKSESAWVYYISLQWRHNGRDGISLTGVSTVCTAVCSGADQRKHQSSASLAFLRGYHWWPVASPHKWSVTCKSLSIDDVIMYIFICINPCAV